MSLNVGKLITSVALNAARAADIVNKALFYVELVEAAADKLGGVPGAKKLEAVREAVEAYVMAEYPDLAAKFADIWGDVAKIVAGAVKLYNAVGLFRKIVSAAHHKV